ncbi:membrane protein of ER body-like protein [Nicotiana tabacum]|uniref:Vacuolar iron transporter n=8 Tax=Nicotiana tabacum TaxID=4097 RepID=A0A1S4CE36_TOBAC|nr:PREDICTED: membrane protein of ER body-like protein [Nicotiana tabacum]
MEIVKSLVYGGLIESITSLVVIFSAAASDADTLKILTIGVANWIGGVFIICQNLMDLKINFTGVGSNLSNQSDQYQELLGQKEHFLLHATVALISYFTFGLVPPVVYGFTYLKSDNKDCKLIAVAIASSLCIIMLATAKAYTRGANKFSKYVKTVLFYGIAASMASGVGYVAGHFVKRLMDKLGWFEKIQPGHSIDIFCSDTYLL